MNEELLRVLDAREKRWQRRLALARGSRRTLITITLCVPVAYRTDPEFERLLLALGRRLGIEPAFIMACGDAGNDLPMLRLAGMPYIMDNAAPALRQQFSLHCRRVEEVLRTL